MVGYQQLSINLILLPRTCGATSFGAFRGPRIGELDSDLMITLVDVVGWVTEVHGPACVDQAGGRRTGLGWNPIGSCGEADTQEGLRARDQVLDHHHDLIPITLANGPSRMIKDQRELVSLLGVAGVTYEVAGLEPWIRL
jgi:hypothetical protein